MGFTNTVFYRPTVDGLQWLVQAINGRPVVEIGAGTGSLASILDGYGINVTAIDTHPDPEAFYPVLTANAITFNYPENCVVIVARPCHSDWVEYAILRAFQCGAEIVFYIGKAQHVESELGAFWYEPMGPQPIGHEGEILYIVVRAENEPTAEDMARLSARISHIATTEGLLANTTTAAFCAKHGLIPPPPGEPDDDGLRTFILIEKSDGASWWEKIGTRAQSAMGGGYQYDELTVIETVRVADWTDLDWKKTSLWDANMTEGGWLSPDGEMWWCRYRSHDQVADMVFGRTRHELEASGFALVRSRDPDDWGMGYKQRPTAAQREFLIANGWEIKWWMTDDDVPDAEKRTVAKIKLAVPTRKSLDGD